MMLFDAEKSLPHAMVPRPYQSAAIVAAANAFYERSLRSILLVLGTGLGKTVIFSHIATDHAKTGRVMVVAHRNELIQQAANKIRAISGENPETEKANQWATSSGNVGASKFIVASVQSLTSGKPDARRMQRFNPSDFSLLVIDEAHRAAASTYGEVIAWFTRNPELRVVGVTATPDRADGENLPFEEITYQFEIHAASCQGWLLMPTARTVVVGELDLSRCRTTTAGDLNDDDVAEAMERVLHPVAHATIEAVFGLDRGILASIRDDAEREDKFRELIKGREPKKTLVFASSVAHGNLLSDIFNRWMERSSRFVCGDTDSAVRAKMLQDFSRKIFPVLVNVGVCTEGYDDPSIEIVVIARPTNSRALFAQMMGRGTRPAEEIASVLGTLATPEERLAAIASSSKPDVLILDFVGNLGKHKLVSAVDVIAGPEWEEMVVQRAKKLAEEKDAKVEECLEEATLFVEQERASEIDAAEAEAEELDAADADAQEQLREAAERRTRPVGTSNYEIEDVDLSDEHATRPERESNVNDNRFRQLAILRKFKVPEADIRQFDAAEIKRVSGLLIARAKQGLCSYGQGKVLQRAGYTREEIRPMTRQQASQLIEEVKANNWKRRREGVEA